MTLLRCYACGEFFDKRLGACPGCETQQRPVNVALINSRWESNLNAQAEHAVKHG